MAEQSRWWDKYYVRYFVGTVYAVPLLLAIALYKKPIANSPIGHLPQDLWTNAAVITAAGLAFCYLASAPILLLHTLRAGLGKSSRSYYAIGVSIAVLALLGLWLAKHFYLTGLDSVFDTSVALGPYIGVVGLQVVGLLSSRPTTIRDFYVQLAAQRKVETPTREDYIESYRHLREHGNALLIILMENVLALALWKANDVTMMVWLILVWVLPATFAWFLGTWLERSMANGEANLRE